MNRAALVGSWRVALRVARRAARRHRGRSVLILLMLFVPAYAATILLTSWANLSGTATQEVTFSLGRADVLVESDNLDAIVASLPPGSRAIPLGQSQTIVEALDGLRVFAYEATDATDPLHQGRYVLRSGQYPTATAETAVSRSLADELGLRLGDRLTAGTPQRDLTVVGIVDWSRALKTPGLLVPAQAHLSAAPAKLLVRLPQGSSWSPTPDGGSLGYLARAHTGPTVEERGMEAVAALLVVSFAGAQVVLLVGAAFLVGAKRQRRELALVAAAGATQRQVSRIVIAGGLLLGAIAAATGVPLGLLTFAAAGGVIERIADHPLIDVSIPVGQLVGVSGVTLTVAVLAALLPARVTARRPTRDALGGQRSRSRLDRYGLIMGLGLLIVGTAALLVSGNPEGRPALLALGGVAQLLGVVSCTPALVRALGRLAGLLPMPGRLALRHAARHRLRTASAMAAVVAAIAGSVALAIAGAASDATAPSQLEARPGQVLLPSEAVELLGPDGLTRLAAELPARATVTLPTATAISVDTGFNDRPEGAIIDPAAFAAMEQRTITVGGAETIQLVTGRAATAPELATLDQGGAVVFNDTLVVNGQVTLTRETGEPISLPSVVAAREEYFPKLPGLVISPATAGRLGLTVAPGPAIVDTTRAPEARELAAANTVLLRAQVNAAQPPGTPITVKAVTVRQPTQVVTIMFYLLAAVSLLVTLIASTVAVGLAVVELRGDLATMAAVGATPRVRRRIASAQSLVIVGLGAALGLISGIGPAAAYVSYNVQLRWHVPWLALLAIVLAPPVLATLVARSLTLGRLSLVRRTS